MSELSESIGRRRTFAIISHPDAGKTTLTEKLLLNGGAINLAGEVKARGERRRTRSDWMKVEQERGISVTVSVMTFQYGGCIFNLLDTPGHEDFSEDTYRTLSAVDSVVMVIDVGKGIESQTRKLFEACRLRDMPIVTFVNKLDRDGREPLEILDEIENSLQIEVTPGTWPVGMGRLFKGCYDLRNDRLLLLEGNRSIDVENLEDPVVEDLLPGRDAENLREGVEMARELCPPFDRDAYLAGNQSPVFFGSALNSFGVSQLLDALVDFAPPPGPRPTKTRMVQPDENKTSGFVFKIQANMDPRHRDRLAFVRLCSGKFSRGMKLFHSRSGRSFSVHNPMMFFARDRQLAEVAWPGDIIGLPNHGNLHIGDSLTESEVLQFVGIPSFAPELMQRVRPEDPLRAKHLGKALLQLAEEGAAQVLRPLIGNDWIVGAQGALQFEVLADRIRTEYNVPVHFGATQFQRLRWLEADDPAEVKRFMARHQDSAARDHRQDPVLLARSDWHVTCMVEDWPQVRFLKTKEQLTDDSGS